MDQWGLINEIVGRVQTYALANFRENWKAGIYENENGNLQYWAPRKHEYKHPILIRTSKMINSLSGSNFMGVITLKVSTPYAGYIHYGTEEIYRGATSEHTDIFGQRQPKQIMPPRPLLYDNSKVHERVLLAIDEIMHEAFGYRRPSGQRRIGR